MEMNENIVLTVNGYEKVDGRNAYQSQVKRLTLGVPTMQENKNMQIAAQIWNENENGELEISTELPIHQIFDLMILLSRSLLYFKEAYRFPLLYDPNKPTVERLGMQGDVFPVEICTDNPNIEKDIQDFSQALNNLGELTGERLRVLIHIINELEEY